MPLRVLFGEDTKLVFSGDCQNDRSKKNLFNKKNEKRKQEKQEKWKKKKTKDGIRISSIVPRTSVPLVPWLFWGRDLMTGLLPIRISDREFPISLRSHRIIRPVRDIRCCFPLVPISIQLELTGSPLNPNVFSAFSLRDLIFVFFFEIDKNNFCQKMYDWPGNWSIRNSGTQIHF